MNYLCVRRSTASFLLLLVLCAGINGTWVTTSALTASAEGGNTVYIPVVMNMKTIAPPTAFGVEMTRASQSRGLSDAVAMGATWVRRNSLQWNDVQPAAGGSYRWDAPAVKALEQEMIEASAKGAHMVLTVHGSPRWAAASGCGAIKPEYYDDFATFLAAAASKYSHPPYSVRYWEIGNEPDVDPSALGNQDSPYGCWGNQNDSFYGGKRYGEMLKAIYPSMKAVNSNLQVLNGGLLLDRPYDPKNDQGTRPGRFLEGILTAGAANSFDILSFHSYYHYYGTSSTPDGLTTVPSSTGRNDWKVSYVKGLLAKYGVQSKPLLNTEGALLCRMSSVEPCLQPQADAVGRIYARALRDGLMGVLWYIYDSDGFHRTALIEPNNVAAKRPAYFAYRHASAMLGGATYLGQLTGQRSGVEGYQFRRGNETVTIVWSNTPQSASIPVGSGSVNCTNRDGGAVSCAKVSGKVTLQASSGPTYVVAR